MQLLDSFVSGKVSYPNMAILKIGPYLGNHCSSSRSFVSGQVSYPHMAIMKKEVYVQLLDLLSVAKCHTQIWTF